MTDLIKQARVTWKSIVALATALAGALSAANVAGFDLPPGLSKIMVAVGVGALFVERLAETVDNYVLKKWGSISPAGRAELELIFAKLRPELEKIADPVDIELKKIIDAAKRDVAVVEKDAEAWIDPAELAKAKATLNAAGYDAVVSPNAPLSPTPAPPAPTPQPVATTGRID